MPLKKKMVRLRLDVVLGLLALVLSPTPSQAVVRDANADNNNNLQESLSYLPPFGVCYGLPTDPPSGTGICPVYGLSASYWYSYGETEKDTTPFMFEKQTSSHPGPASQPSQENQPTPPQSQSQAQSKSTIETENGQRREKEETRKSSPSQSSSPWSRGAICRRVGQDDFCAFTHSSFNNGEGISVITTPAVFVGLSSQAPFNAPITSQETKHGSQAHSQNSEEDGDGQRQSPDPYKDLFVPGKGIGLVATQSIRSGRRIMARTPAIMVDDRAFRGLRQGDLALLLAQGIAGLPDFHRSRFLNLSSSNSISTSHNMNTVSEEEEVNSPKSETKHEEQAANMKRQVDLIYQIFTTNAFKTTLKVKATIPSESSEQGKKKTTGDDSDNDNVQVKGKGKDMDIDFHSTFTEVSRLNHDCAPNLGYYFDTSTLSHKVYAVRDIPAGEELSISYVDVLHDRQTRQRLLKNTWGFDCSCERCGGGGRHQHVVNGESESENDDAHLLAESDSRVEQINALRRELDNYSSLRGQNKNNGGGIGGGGSGGGTPAKAVLLITLYNLEGVDVRIYEAYYRAALEYNGVGDATNAIIYARLCLARGLIARGPDRPFIVSMRALIRDPVNHWSWRFRVGASTGTSSGGEGAAAAAGGGGSSGEGSERGQEA